MARIAEDLLLLLLDNESAQPRMKRRQLGRTLAAALLLDLAYDCRVRPALPGEPVAPGHLVALAGPVPMDPALRPVLAMLERRPVTPDVAIGKLRGRAEDDVLDQLLRTGQIHQIQLSSHRLRRNTYAWPLSDRSRSAKTRAAAHGALFDHHSPDPAMAAVIALLHRTGGLPAALNLSDEGAYHAVRRAEEITFAGWGEGANTGEVNLAMTAASVLPVL